MATLKGNVVFGQSGGPTAVINASIGGALQEALKHDCFQELYGMTNGILGVLEEELFDLRKESPETLEHLKTTPSSAVGSCRYKVKSDADQARIVEVLQAHHIRYLFLAGGNDTMDTAAKVARLAAESGYELIAVGIPKTIDNDLAVTDHCPGYGSVAKYNATMVMEAARDTEAMYTVDTCTVVETMGRNAGWIAAATGVARRSAEDGPDLVYVPECPKTVEDIVTEVKVVLAQKKRCFIVAAEGLKTPEGKYLAEETGAFAKDAFGHTQLGGIAEFLQKVVQEKVGVKCRYCKPGTIQRNGMHFASRTDVKEAYQVGRKAVQLAARGGGGVMVTLVRTSDDPYRCTTGTAPLEVIANGEKYLPREYLNEAGNHITAAMRRYVVPLMRGSAPLRMGEDGLPLFMRFKRVSLGKKCPPWRRG